MQQKYLYASPPFSRTQNWKAVQHKAIYDQVLQSNDYCIDR